MHSLVHSLAVFLGPVLLLLPLHPAAEAGSPENYREVAEFRYSPPSFLNSFGRSVAISGDFGFISVPLENMFFTFTSGKVEVYRRNGEDFPRIGTLAPPDGAARDEFGRYLSANSEWLAVGAPVHQSSRGAVYLYSLEGESWQFHSKLMATPAAEGARFGRSIAIDHARLAVGAPGANGDRGTVYLYRLEGSVWQLEAQVSATDGFAEDFFGEAVALEGDRLLVGANGADINTQPRDNRGAAYLFNRVGNSWTQAQKLTRPLGPPNQGFGVAVALSDRYAVIGAPAAEFAALSSAGVIQILQVEGSSLVLQEEIASSVPQQTAAFGSAIKLDGDRLFVGSPRATIPPGLQQGWVEELVNEFGAWRRSEVIFTAAAADNDRFGDALALGPNFVLIGAPQKSSLEGAGFAFIGLEARLDVESTPAIVTIGEAASVLSSLETNEGPLDSGSVEVLLDGDNGCVAPVIGGQALCEVLAVSAGPRLLQVRYSGAEGVRRTSASLQIQVVPDLSITPVTLPRAQIGRSYVASFDSPATGATAPLAWNLASGALPPGLALAPGGNLSGTPSAFGSFSFTVTVTDSSGAELGGPFSESRAYQLEVDPPFTTQLDLLDANSQGDRGQSRTFSAHLTVVEDGASAPAGNYAVSASNGASVLSCSAPVTDVGPQSCSIEFGPGAAVGDYAVSAVFVSSSAEMGGSSAGGSHRLFSPADPAIGVETLDPAYLPESTVRHRIRVENLGPDTAFQLTLASSLSPGLSALQWTCSGAGCPAGAGSGLPNLTIPALSALASVEFLVEGVLGATPPSQLQFEASVSLMPTGFSRELDADNNADSATSLPARLFRDGFESPEPP